MSNPYIYAIHDPPSPVAPYYLDDEQGVAWYSYQYQLLLEIEARGGCTALALHTKPSAAWRSITPTHSAAMGTTLAIWLRSSSSSPPPQHNDLPGHNRRKKEIPSCRPFTRPVSTRAFTYTME